MVPNGWKKESLSDVTAVIDCKHRTPIYVEAGIPLVSPGTIKWGALDLVSPVKRVSKDEYESLMDHCTIDTGDLVMSRNQSVGIASYVETDEPFVLGQDTVLIKPKKVDSKFVFYKLQSEVVQRSIIKLAGGSTFSRINLADIRKLKLNFPPLPEQKKIAQILSTWDKAITTTEQLLSNSQQQKKALMQQLLTGKKRLLDKNGVRFSGEWIEVSLSTICQINPKKPASPADGKVSFVAMEAVSEDAKLLSSVVRDYDDVCKGFTSFADNDVLVAKITPCFENGKGAYVEGMQNGIGFGSTEFHVLRAGAKSDSKYLYYLTNTSEFRVRGEANMQGSAGQKRVTTDYLKSLKVIVPTDVVEQQKIAAVLSTADHEISALQQKLYALKQEKKALMQQLLTGKRRVSVS
ncbi:restriction endonuclease subunit S [Vibrio navarrensis]|nr:restriction endonuclease subunit S [Vibrio navarrensis]EKF9703009.1 restriction endonuclease subunit S [Vibrio cholerae]